MLCEKEVKRSQALRTAPRASTSSAGSYPKEAVTSMHKAALSAHRKGLSLAWTCPWFWIGWLDTDILVALQRQRWQGMNQGHSHITTVPCRVIASCNSSQENSHRNQQPTWRPRPWGSLWSHYSSRHQPSQNKQRKFMPASACGELHIPCLTRVPASETTATGTRRTSALSKGRTVLAAFPSSWGWYEGGEFGESHWTCGPGFLLWSLKRSSLSSCVNIPRLSQWGHFLFNSSGKVTTTWPWRVPPAKARIPRERLFCGTKL